MVRVNIELLVRVSTEVSIDRWDCLNRDESARKIAEIIANEIKKLLSKLSIEGIKITSVEVSAKPTYVNDDFECGLLMEELTDEE